MWVLRSLPILKSFIKYLETIIKIRGSDNCSHNLVPSRLWWVKTTITDKQRSQITLWGVILLLKFLVLKLILKKWLQARLFYSNQFWGLPKLLCFYKTLKSISVCRSWNNYTSASSNYDLPFNHQLKKCHCISNHCEWDFIGSDFKWSRFL